MLLNILHLVILLMMLIFIFLNLLKYCTKKQNQLSDTGLCVINGVMLKSNDDICPVERDEKLFEQNFPPSSSSPIYHFSYSILFIALTGCIFNYDRYYFTIEKIFLDLNKYKLLQPEITFCSERNMKESQILFIANIRSHEITGNSSES